MAHRRRTHSRCTTQRTAAKLISPRSQPSTVRPRVPAPGRRRRRRAPAPERGRRWPDGVWTPWPRPPARPDGPEWPPFPDQESPMSPERVNPCALRTAASRESTTVPSGRREVPFPQATTPADRRETVGHEDPSNGTCRNQRFRRSVSFHTMVTDALLPQSREPDSGRSRCARGVPDLRQDASASGRVDASTEKGRPVAGGGPEVLRSTQCDYEEFGEVP